MEDEAGGDAGLVVEAEAGMETDVVELNGPDSHTFGYIHINAASEVDGESVGGMHGEGKVAGYSATAGLMRSAGQNMYKGGDSSRKENTRTEQVRVGVQAAAAGTARERSVIPAEIRFDRDLFGRFVLETSFPAVQARVAGNSYRGTGRAGAQEHSCFRY